MSAPHIFGPRSPCGVGLVVVGVVAVVVVLIWLEKGRRRYWRTGLPASWERCGSLFPANSSHRPLPPFLRSTPLEGQLRDTRFIELAEPHFHHLRELSKSGGPERKPQFRAFRQPERNPTIF